MDFASSWLSDSDDHIRAAALGVLAAKDTESVRDQLRRALHDDSIGVRTVAVSLIRDVATREDAAVIRQQAIDFEAAELIAELTGENSGNADVLSNSAYAQGMFDILLRVGSPQDRQYAVERLARMLEDGTELKTDLAAYLAGLHELRSLAPTLTRMFEQAMAPEGQKVVAAAALVKFGDERAEKFLRQKVEDAAYAGFILSDRDVVDRLDLSDEQLNRLGKADEPAIRLAVATEFARRGDHEPLRRMAEVLRTDEALVGDILLETDEGYAITPIHLLDAISHHGHRSLLPLLRSYYEHAQEDHLKLTAAAAIIRMRERIGEK